MTELYIQKILDEGGELALHKFKKYTVSAANVKAGYFYDSDEPWGFANRLGLGWKRILKQYGEEAADGTFWVTEHAALLKFLEDKWKKSMLKDDPDYKNQMMLLRRFIAAAEELKSPVRVEV